MRLLLLICFGTASLCAAAQTDDTQLRVQLQKVITKRLAEERRQKSFHHGADTTDHRMNRQLAMRKKPGIYVLPQDNMPCLVPDTKDLVAIPNAAPRVYPYREDMPKMPIQPGEIPNATPFRWHKENPDTK